VLCGAKDWKVIKIDAQLSRLKNTDVLTNGIPTRHLIGKIIQGIKAESLVSFFIYFLNSVRQNKGKNILALMVKREIYPRSDVSC